MSKRYKRESIASEKRGSIAVKELSLKAPNLMISNEKY
jgi:hypothetical protein